MSKNYSRIAHALYHTPWCILPSVHHSLVEQFESHISNNIMDTEEMFSDMMEEVSNVINGIKVINIDGIIGKHLGMMETMCGGVDVDDIAAEIKAAAENPDIQGLVLKITSPGGTPTGVLELGEYIATMRDRFSKGIIAYTDTLVASAAYWLASQCSAFITSKTADIGSVGVYTLLTDKTVALAQAGIKINAISAGKYKLQGAPFKELSDEDRAMIQTEVDKTYTQFKTAILSNRKIEDDDMQGQVFDGETAVNKNFADGIASFDELMTMLTSSGLDK